MLFILLLVLFSARAIMNKPTSNNGVTERIRSRQENVTHMVNVTATLSELCLSFSGGFRCNREVTHFIPKVSLETREFKDLVTSCCPAYIRTKRYIQLDISVVDLGFIEDFNTKDVQIKTANLESDKERKLILDEAVAKDIEAKTSQEDLLVILLMIQILFLISGIYIRGQKKVVNSKWKPSLLIRYVNIGKGKAKKSSSNV